MPEEALAPFRFELIFTGLSMIDVTGEGATVFLVNAADPARFVNDPDTADIASGINPHFPRLSYHMSQQVRGGTETPRLPDRIFSGPAGEEVGVCDVEEEDLTLVSSGRTGFQPGLLAEAPSLSTLTSTQIRRSPLLNSALPNPAVTTRFHFAEGALETLRLSFAGEVPLQIEFRTIRTFSTPSRGPEQTIADQLVLRIDGLTAPVEIRSDKALPLRLRPDRDPSRASRPVTVSLANFHQEFHPHQELAFDFLWLYELVDFDGSRPSRNDLPIPFALNHPDTDLTGSSAVCPPIKI